MSLVDQRLTHLVPENKEQDVRTEVIHICQAILPEYKVRDVIDTVQCIDSVKQGKMSPSLEESSCSLPPVSTATKYGKLQKSLHFCRTCASLRICHRTPWRNGGSCGHKWPRHGNKEKRRTSSEEEVLLKDLN